MEIGGIKLKSDILLAPIAGFTDVGFRHLCARYGAGITYTELVSAKGLVYGNKGEEALVATTPIETPCAVQLFGSDPEFIYRAAKDERLKKFDIIDINMGCPVKKVFSNGDGSALMNTPSLAGQIVAAAIEGGGRPVTVKMRAGIVSGKPLAVECALAVERAGASAVTIHPRFRDQFYSGRADHTIVREVKQAVSIPVIANGDIVDAASLDEVRRITGADAFMVARGALGRPYIFSELLGEPYSFDVGEAVNTHVSLLREVMPDRVVVNVMKQHLCHYFKGCNLAKQVRVAAGNAKSIEDIFAIVAQAQSSAREDGTNSVNII